MTTFERWDIVTALFPFSDVAVRRPRPVLVLSGVAFNQQPFTPGSWADKASARLHCPLEAVYVPFTVTSRRIGTVAIVDRGFLAGKLDRIFRD